MNLYILFISLLIILTICIFYYLNSKKKEPMTVSEKRTRMLELKNKNGKITKRLNRLNLECSAVNSCSELTSLNQKYSDIGGCGKCIGPGGKGTFHYFINENNNEPAAAVCPSDSLYSINANDCQMYTDIRDCSSSICPSISDKANCGYNKGTDKVIPIANGQAKYPFPLLADSSGSDIFGNLITNPGECPLGKDDCHKKENRRGPHSPECYNQLMQQIRNSDANWVTEDNSNNWLPFIKDKGPQNNSYTYDNSGADPNYKTEFSLKDKLKNIFNSVIGDLTGKVLTYDLSRNYKLIHNRDANYCDFKFNEDCAKEIMNDEGCINGLKSKREYYKNPKIAKQWYDFSNKTLWEKYVKGQHDLAKEDEEIMDYNKWKNANYFCNGDKENHTQLKYQNGCKVKYHKPVIARKNYIDPAIKYGERYEFYGIVCGNDSRGVPVIWTHIISTDSSKKRYDRKDFLSAQIQHDIFGNCNFFNNEYFDLPSKVPTAKLTLLSPCITSGVEFEEKYTEGFQTIADNASACNDGCNQRQLAAKKDIRSDKKDGGCKRYMIKRVSDFYCVNKKEYREAPKNIKQPDCNVIEKKDTILYELKTILNNNKDTFSGWKLFQGSKGHTDWHTQIHEIDLKGTYVITNLSLGLFQATRQDWGNANYIDFYGVNDKTKKSNYLTSITLNKNGERYSFSNVKKNTTDDDVKNSNNYVTHIQIKVRHLGNGPGKRVRKCSKVDCDWWCGFWGGSSEKCSTSESAPYGAYVEYGGFTNFTVKGYEVKFPEETDINKYCEDS
jgi:hypothetical protein